MVHTQLQPCEACDVQGGEGDSIRSTLPADAYGVRSGATGLRGDIATGVAPIVTRRSNFEPLEGNGRLPKSTLERNAEKDYELDEMA